MGKNSTLDKYLNTPRKIFDKHVDRMELRRSRDREDHRADMKTLITRLVLVEKYLAKIEAASKKHGCEDPTCKFCHEDWDSHNDLEGLE